MSPKAKQGSPDNAAEDKPRQSSQEEGSAQSRLPFEPAPTRKKPAKTGKNTPTGKNKPTTASPANQPAKQEKTSQGKTSQRKRESGVPKAVSSRMVRRMAFFSGLPTAMGMLTFVASYIVVSQEWMNLPNVAVVLVSMGCFGLGVLGLSYGVLSASWDEERVGSWLGWGEFATNFGRVVESWRSQGKEPNP